MSLDDSPSNCYKAAAMVLILRFGRGGGGWNVNFLLFEIVFKDWNPSVPHISTYLSKPIPSPIEV